MGFLENKLPVRAGLAIELLADAKGFSKTCPYTRYVFSGKLPKYE